MFLSALQPVLPEERYDFQQIVSRLEGSQHLVVFQPAIYEDFFPMAMLKNEGILQEARNGGKEIVWLVSSGVSDSYGTEYFGKVFTDFYIRDELPDLKLPDQIKGMEVEEMLLLHSESLTDRYRMPDLDEVNVVYVSLSVPNGLNVHVFVCAGSMNQVWDAWTVRAHCGIDWLIESGKGMGEHFAFSELLHRFMAFDRKSLLPSFYIAGFYADYINLPESFHCFKIVRIDRKTVRFFLCPWGQENAYAESIIRKEQETGQKLEESRAAFEAFKMNLSAHPPLPALRYLYAKLREEINKDGDVSNYYEIEDMSFYSEPCGDDSGSLSPRVELFAVVTALALFEETRDARSRAFSYMDAIVQYHIKRCVMKRWTDAYIFYSADRDLQKFFTAIYDDVKCFSSEPVFADYIARHEQNLLEETLLRTAYKRKDYEYADWLIENRFYGNIQPELYYIICNHDKTKADAIAKRLMPHCIARIVKDYMASKRIRADEIISRDQNDDTIDPLNCIFRSINKETACAVKGSMTRRDTVSWNLYLKLMEKYFG